MASATLGRIMGRFIGRPATTTPPTWAELPDQHYGLAAMPEPPEAIQNEQEAASPSGEMMGVEANWDPDVTREGELDSDLLEQPAVAAAAAALGQLARAVALERSASPTHAGPTIEDMIREQIRPLLQAWVDEHMEGVVERLVRHEIERVVGRAFG